MKIRSSLDTRKKNRGGDDDHSETYSVDDELEISTSEEDPDYELIEQDKSSRAASTKNANETEMVVYEDSTTGGSSRRTSKR